MRPLNRIASVARKQREEDRERDWCSAHFFSVLLTLGPRPWSDATHIQEVGLPFSGQPPRKLPQRRVFCVVAKLAKLMVKINRHTNITGDQVSGVLWLGSVVHWSTKAVVFLHRKQWLL